MAVTAELNLESISRMGPPIRESIKLSCGGNAFTRRRCCPADMGCFDSVRLPPHFAQHDRGGKFSTCYLKIRYLLLESHLLFMLLYPSLTIITMDLTG